MDQSIGNTAGHAARKVAAWVPVLTRLGYAAKGVVFVLIGWIALRAAMEAGSPEGASGALASLADENDGKIMLILIALGLPGHVAGASCRRCWIPNIAAIATQSTSRRGSSTR